MQKESPLTAIRRQLSGIYPAEEARSLTRLLAEDGLGIPMLDFYTGKVKELSEEKEQILQKMLHRLLRHEPIQYVLGRTEFEGLSFHTAPGVLIPRPETGELVEWICSSERPSRLLDIGTGSGCIAISLARHFPNARVDAWDISPDALRIATENNRLHETDVVFKKRDVLTYISSGDETASYDVLVSNPPYVTEKERVTMDANVLDWEPATALFVPDDDPLRFYRAIARLGKTLLRPVGKLYFEINCLFSREMKQLLEKEGYTAVTLRKDMFGKERMIRAERPRTINHCHQQ